MSTINFRQGFSPQSPDLKRRLRGLMKPSTKAGMVAIIGDWTAIIGAASASWWAYTTLGTTLISVLSYACAALLIASRQRGLENLVHEATHYHLSPHWRLNEAMGWFLAIPLGHSLMMERLSHVIGHHARFWDSAHDPDVQRYKAIGIDQLPAVSTPQLLCLLARGFVAYFLGAMRTFFLPPAEPARLRFLRGAFWLMAIALAISTGYIVPCVLYWLIPLFVVLTPMRFVAEISEHSAMGCSTVFGTTRNNIGLVQRYFLHPHGDGYHLVHHLFPGIPHHNLARAHALLMQDPVYRSMGRHCYGLIAARHGRRSTLADLTSRT